MASSVLLQYTKVKISFCHLLFRTTQWQAMGMTTRGIIPTHGKTILRTMLHSVYSYRIITNTSILYYHIVLLSLSATPSCLSSGLNPITGRYHHCTIIIRAPPTVSLPYHPGSMPAASLYNHVIPAISVDPLIKNVKLLPWKNVCGLMYSGVQ